MEGHALTESLTHRSTAQIRQRHAALSTPQPVAALRSAAGLEPLVFEATLQHLTNARLLTTSGEITGTRVRNAKDERSWSWYTCSAAAMGCSKAPAGWHTTD